MSTRVNVERSKLNKAYEPLRDKIIDYYKVLELTGQGPQPVRQRRPKSEGSKMPPPKLGHWDAGPDGHSARIMAAYPELTVTVRAIEALIKLREPSRIEAMHPPFKRGNNFRRRGMKDESKRLNPGEWPPRYRK